MATLYSPKIITDGLVLALDAANPKSYPGSGTVWKDLSGNGNNGTLINGPTFDSDNGGSIVFDGVDDYVNVNTSTNFFETYDSSVTYEVWSYTPSTSQWHDSGIGGSGTNIVSRGTYAGYNGLGRLSTNNVVAAYYRGSTSGVASASTTIGRDMWYHLVSIWTGIRAELYVDGVLRATNGTSLVGNPNSGVVSIARQRALGGNNGGWYDGLLSGVKTYNRALTAQEIQQNYNATKGRYGL
jgi:hypothetical protein